MESECDQNGPAPGAIAGAIASPIAGPLSGFVPPVPTTPAAQPVEPAGDDVEGIRISSRTSLSPSRASDFMTCPLLYRFRVIDRLPQAPSVDAVGGSVVHKVLEHLFDEPASERTHERANLLLGPAWEELLEREPEL